MKRSEIEEQVLDFAERVFVRAEGRDDVNEQGHEPNWGDRPARFRSYPAMPSIPLPGPSRLLHNFRALRQEGSETSERPTVEHLSQLLYMVLGPLRRRLDLNWNSTLATTTFPDQNFGRGTASGGGLYPVQCYLAIGEGSTLRPGIYHYSDGAHALTPIRWGSFTVDIAQAISTQTQSCASQYLVLAIDFWRNCFKYNNFGYHVCSEDVGATIATVQSACEALSIPMRTHLNFTDERVNQLIRADGSVESAFALIALGDHLATTAAAHNDVRDYDPAFESLPGQTPPALRPWQRSRTVSLPQELQTIHRLGLQKNGNEMARIATTATTAAMTAIKMQSSSGGDAVPFPLDQVSPDSEGIDGLTAHINRSLPGILLARRSAWGSMGGASPIPAGCLQQMLGYMQPDQAAVVSIHEALPADALTLYLRVHKVGAMPPGGYRWDHQSRCLAPRRVEPITSWQETYSMNNYNIDEAGVVLFVAGDLSRVMEVYGARGYRVLNAHVGYVAQRAYLAAEALGLACGVVLGVRAQRVKRIFRLPASQNVYLAIYLGQRQQRVEMFDFRLAADVPLGYL